MLHLNFDLSIEIKQKISGLNLFIPLNIQAHFIHTCDELNKGFREIFSFISGRVLENV